MRNYPKALKRKLLDTICQMREELSKYTADPKRDFTRNRKLPFETLCRTILSMSGQSLNVELQRQFHYDPTAATTSAFVQQRGKLLPTAFEEIFRRFTYQNRPIRRWNGYTLLAVDGSHVQIPSNIHDEATYFNSTKDGRGYNLLHLNALYDLESQLYLDAVIQDGREEHESRALVELVDRSELTEPVILIADRGYEANVLSRNGGFEKEGKAKFKGTEIMGKTFGQIGMGNISQRIARIMRDSFGCKVLGYDPYISAEEAGKRGFIKCETMEELLEQSDYVNVNVPLSPSTTNMISREKMEHFKPGSYFVNAARGGVADEDALYDALVSGRLAGAACDTFVGGEPVSKDHKLLTLPNFSATPHIGGNTNEALQKTGMEVVRITLDYLSGKPVQGQVNRF